MSARLVHNHGIDPSCRERLVGECQLRPGGVTIDPDDAEQVERLIGLLNAHHDSSSNPNARGFSVCTDYLATQAALREFASPTPPKPEEPTGLGAVVEDETGRQWVRMPGMFNEPWVCNGLPSAAWVHLGTVRVLSEGVTP